jgi:hypothetical protein|tara:strand:+ start:1477 stop:1686 length:210 start_codon:yes stop_codon:yes gene_type:complete
MTTWTTVSTSTTSWTSVPETAQGYFETEDNLFLIATENNELLQQEDLTDIAPGNWQDAPTVATTTWTVQ